MRQSPTMSRRLLAAPLPAAPLPAAPLLVAFLLAAFLLGAALLGACSAEPSSPPAAPPAASPAPPPAPSPEAGLVGVPPTLSGPTVVAVGTVQDGGLPHTACSCDRCEAARHDPARRRHVASLAVVLPRSGAVYLLDATPDITEQLALLRPYRRASPPGRVDRAPLAGIFLTHAHIGHYLGLAHLGFEVVHTRDLPVYATPRMADFLRDNGPWSQLVSLGNIDPRPTRPGATVDLGEGVRVTGLLVPHRDEFSDTVAWRIDGPHRNLLYLPDTEPWERWARPVDEVLAGVDVALLDGTFYSLDELPGRSISQIGHPLMTSTMDLLAARVREGGLRVLFTHLNHSNPALEPGSAARTALEERGFAILAEGEEIPL